MHGKTRSRWIPRSVIVLIAVIICSLVSVSGARETYRSWRIDQDIVRLQSQLIELEGKRTELAKTLQQWQTPEMIDREARLRLGMQKPGEQVFVVRGELLASRDAQRVSPTSTNEYNRSNPAKWFAYFFFGPRVRP